MSDGAKGLTRQQMCDRLAMEFEDGWIVNLGIGIPTLCSNFDFGDKEIIFHAENGDFANWKMAGQKGGGIGGAMDLAACAKHVFVAMEQVTRNGRPRLVERCAIPATARGVVDLVITNYGLFEITPEGMTLRELAPGVTVDEIKATTGCNLSIPREVPPVRLRG